MNIISEELVQEVIVTSIGAGVSFAIFIVPLCELVAEIVSFLLKKLKILYYAKRYGCGFIVDTIDCAYLLTQKGELPRPKAELIEVALTYYMRRKKVKMK